MYEDFIYIRVSVKKRKPNGVTYASNRDRRKYKKHNNTDETTAEKLLLPRGRARKGVLIGLDYTDEESDECVNNIEIMKLKCREYMSILYIITVQYIQHLNFVIEREIGQEQQNSGCSMLIDSLSTLFRPPALLLDHIQASLATIDGDTARYCTKKLLR
ncbi:9714_t:CDS:2 [Paraglomus occultum]|uniref:9714_t:CDS:1 n=1 Tax=Paraglomus occultum TaxID=144539 RepID=A0A9N9CPV0_9GLOM|nr:9714_t:CDS:2 [Paraglomus occultum]